MDQLLILGEPSGIGKSSVGRWLAENRGFTHVELDGEGTRDMVDELKLRLEWTALLAGDSAPLLSAMRGNSVLTLPSFPIFTKAHRGLRGVRIRYMVSPASVCLREFEIREKATGRALSTGSWLHNNSALFYSLENGDIPQDWQVPAFGGHGQRVSSDKLAELILR